MSDIFDYQTLGGRPATYAQPTNEALSRAGVTRSISVPFRIGLDGGVVASEGRSNIMRQEILTVIMTFLGERLMMPYYGSNLPEYVWSGQSSSVAPAFLAEVESLVQEQFPGVQILNLSFDETTSEDGELKFIFEYAFDDVLMSVPIDASQMLNEGPT